MTRRNGRGPVTGNARDGVSVSAVGRGGIDEMLAVFGLSGRIVTAESGHVCASEEFSVDGGVWDVLAEGAETGRVMDELAEVYDIEGLMAAVQYLTANGQGRTAVAVCRCGVGRPPLLQWSTGPDVNVGGPLFED